MQNVWRHCYYREPQSWYRTAPPAARHSTQQVRSRNQEQLILSQPRPLKIPIFIWYEIWNISEVFDIECPMICEFCLAKFLFSPFFTFHFAIIFYIIIYRYEYYLQNSCNAKDVYEFNVDFSYEWTHRMLTAANGNSWRQQHCGLYRCIWKVCTCTYHCFFLNIGLG